MAANPRADPQIQAKIQRIDGLAGRIKAAQAVENDKAGKNKRAYAAFKTDWEDMEWCQRMLECNKIPFPGTQADKTICDKLGLAKMHLKNANQQHATTLLNERIAQYQNQVNEAAELGYHARVPSNSQAKNEYFNNYYSDYDYYQQYSHHDLNDIDQYISSSSMDNKKQYQQQSQSQSLLPQQVILPVQYGLNNNLNGNNNGQLNNDGNSVISQEWLAVILPILLISACLFGIICMICMGVGGLFCYREGKRATDKNQYDNNNAFYHKLSHKFGADNNKRDRHQLADFDEVCLIQIICFIKNTIICFDTHYSLIIN